MSTEINVLNSIGKTAINEDIIASPTTSPKQHVQAIEIDDGKALYENRLKNIIRDAKAKGSRSVTNFTKCRDRDNLVKSSISIERQLQVSSIISAANILTESNSSSISKQSVLNPIKKFLEPVPEQSQSQISKQQTSTKNNSIDAKQKPPRMLKKATSGSQT